MCRKKRRKAGKVIIYTPALSKRLTDLNQPPDTEGKRQKQSIQSSHLSVTCKQGCVGVCVCVCVYVCVFVCWEQEMGKGFQIH